MATKQSSITGKVTLVEIYEDAPDVIIESGVLKGNMTLSEVISYGKHSRFTQNFTFNDSHIKLWKDGKKLKSKTIREAFTKYGAPITLELQDKKTTTTFSKEY